MLGKIPNTNRAGLKDKKPVVDLLRTPHGTERRKTANRQHTRFYREEPGLRDGLFTSREKARMRMNFFDSGGFVKCRFGGFGYGLFLVRGRGGKEEGETW